MTAGELITFLQTMDERHPVTTCTVDEDAGADAVRIVRAVWVPGRGAVLIRELKRPTP